MLWCPVMEGEEEEGGMPGVILTIRCWQITLTSYAGL